MKYLLIFLIALNVNAKINSLGVAQLIATENVDNGKNICGLNKDESSAVLNLIHMKIDQQSKKFSIQKNIADIKNCKKSCSCTFYNSILIANPNLKNIKKAEAVLAKNKMNEKDIQLCFKKAELVCKSKKFIKLRKEMKDFLPSENAK